MESTDFGCQYCKESLYGKKYTLKDDSPYCVKCFESLFANICEGCKKSIECDSKDFSYKDSHWHEACFKCDKCFRSLVEKPFAAKDDLLLCIECYSNEYSSKCFDCKGTIMPGSRKIEFKGCNWHETCFICQICRQPIGTKHFVPKQPDIYCVPCYEKQFANQCKSCKKNFNGDSVCFIKDIEDTKHEWMGCWAPYFKFKRNNFVTKAITTDGITFQEQPWHKECFVCTNCKKKLSGEKFTSQEESPYCMDCFSNLYGKKCNACSKPITAKDGVKYISFEDRQWHSDCFICAKCTISLVGQRFLMQHNDILCPVCGRDI